jgi:hypothetical protein
MKPKYLVVLLVSLLIVPVFLYYGFLANDSLKGTCSDLYVGVDVAYDNLTEIKKLIDQVSPYTNLFVIGCTGITQNVIRNVTTGRILSENFTELNETCKYVYDKGLSFIIYREWPFRTAWLENATKAWGDRFLGIYPFDEVGGYQLDSSEYRSIRVADNITDAASQFINETSLVLNRFTRFYTNSTRVPLFTSDYALYWFDYKAGYDVLLAQFGWNYSRQLNVALCRGAAMMQNKDWGVMITWTYTDPPYIETGEKLYEDLITAYKNGAKYIVVFDANKNYTHGILKEEHLEALKQFWQYVQRNPRSSDKIGGKVAYILPKDYGYGFRGPDDKFWGLWEANASSTELCNDLGSLLKTYDDRLDIIYDDGLNLIDGYQYSQLIFWNGTIWNPSISPRSPRACAFVG